MTDWLLGTLVATSALVLLVLAAREPVRRHFGSRVAYGLWLIPAGRAVMPALTHTAYRSASADPALQPLLRPIAGEPLLLANLAPPEPSMLARLGGWPGILIILWLAVALALFLSRIIAFRRDRRAILSASLEGGRVGSVRIVRSGEVTSPVAFGIFDRVIAVPADFDTRYGARERRFALEHELAHHRSGDLVANLFAFVLLCLQWFNPLAWVAHAVFRFDQEAACDARVLEKVNVSDRADYGRAIAKAASGRALLFASALDRHHRLHRRLQSMLRSPQSERRLAGRVIVLAAIAVALPLTASHAVRYVDLPGPAARSFPTLAPAPSVRAAPMAAAAVAAQAVPSAAPAPATNSVTTISDDVVVIDGKTRKWEELTPEEKAKVRDAVAKARAALGKVHFDRAAMERAIAAIPDSRRMEEIQRDVARATAGAEEAARAIEANSAELGQWGIKADQMAARIRAVNSAGRPQNFPVIDRQKLAESMAKAEQGISAAQAGMDKIEQRLREGSR